MEEDFLDRTGDLLGDLLFSPSGEGDPPLFSPFPVVFMRTLVSRWRNLKMGKQK